MSRSESVLNSAPSVSARFAGSVRRSEAVVFTELDDLVVMLDTDKGLYYELDGVGSRIWNLLEEEPTVRGLHRALTGEFDVDAETCRDELLTFIEKLHGLSLVRLDEEASSGAE